MDEDFAVSDNIYLSPKIAHLCSAMSRLSLHEKNLSNKTGDPHQSKAKNDVFDNTGKIKEMEKPVIQAGDKLKVVDEGGDAGRKSVISGPIGTQKELDDHKGTLVSGGSTDGDDCAEVLGHDHATAVPPKEPDGEKRAAPVPDVTAVDDLCSEEPENDEPTVGPPKEPDEEKVGAPASDCTAVDCHCAEVLENEEATAEPPKEVDVDKGAAHVSHRTAIEDIWAEVQEHVEATTGPLKEADEGNGAAPVPDGTSVEDLCTEVLKQYEATAAPPKDDVGVAGSPQKPDGHEAVDDAYPSRVSLRVAERQQSERQYLQARDQPGSASDLVPGKDDQRSHWSRFITHITEEEFANAPKYAKGKLSLDMVENLVDAFNDALARKYRLLALPKSQVPKLQRGRVAAYKEQETAETKQRRFLVESDLTGMGGMFASRRTAASFFLLMRHCGKIREIRGPGRIVRYTVH